MPDPQLEAISKDLHPQAGALVRAHVNEFATSLLLQAKMIAYQRRADVVLTTHVDEARNVILSEHTRSRSRELKIAVGGALFGAFIQGFINELSLPSLRPLWIAIYTLAGFVGIFLIFWGLGR
jgi:hypothetical protein